MHLRDMLFLIMSFLFVYYWDKFGSSTLTVPILGVLIFVYIVTNFGQKVTKDQTAPTPLPHESFHASLLVMTVLLLLQTSGMQTSPFFFLLYFLPFAISFLMSPMSSLIFAILLALFFYPTLLTNDFIPSMLQIGSVIGLTPLAYWLGSEFRHHLAESQRTNEAATRIVTDVGTILTDKTKTLSQKESKALTDILEQVETIQKT